MKRIIHVLIFRGDKYFVAELEGEDPAHFGLAPDASILASYELEPEPQIHAKA